MAELTAVLMPALHYITYDVHPQNHINVAEIFSGEKNIEDTKRQTRRWVVYVGCIYNVPYISGERSTLQPTTDVKKTN